MRILHTIPEMRDACAERFRTGSARLGLVPTMGALHEGHLSLLRAARQRCPLVAATIFVNPLQFGPTEDFSRYPSTFTEDCALLEREGVALLFAPTVEEMYPHGNARTFVDVSGIGDRLDGRSRPGHFRGVATVVAKLLNIVSPDEAFFGQKDAAQVAVLRAMARDLNFNVELIICPTVREEDGLALSSRNRYLNQQERAQALALYCSLQSVQQAVSTGESDASTLRQHLLQRLQAAEGIRLDYAEIVDPSCLQPVNDLRNGALVAVAATVGSTRLIDNILLPPSSSRGAQ